ncbi:MAG: PQQ-binding-like beta-propeller repeat protein [Salinisphaeraceae bacterium]
MNNTTRAALAAILISTGVGASPDDWPLHGGDHANTRFATLSQINRDNVDNLELVWQHDNGRKASFQATPIVHGDRMYLSTPYNDVVALDATSGEQLWRYRHETTTDKFCCGPSSRGVAVAGNRVFLGTIDARLIALDADTGEVIWDVQPSNTRPDAAEAVAAITGNPHFTGGKVVGATGLSFNMAPQVVDGKVFVGTSGAGYGLHVETDEQGQQQLSVIGIAGGGKGLRGFLAAFDADSGEELWRWHTVNEADWAGDFASTTPGGTPLKRDIDAERAAMAEHGGAWRVGGGSIWQAPAVDRELGLLYVGTGNPSPQIDGQSRPGDNRHTSSIVALDIDTGNLAWAFQQVPHDQWGYEAASPPVLFDAEIEGKPRKLLAQAGKTGWLYLLDRTSGELVKRSEPFVPQENLFAPPTEDGTRVTPAILGGASWSPAARHPARGLIYVQGIHKPATYFIKPLEAGPDSPWESYGYFRFTDEPDWGNVSAIDPVTGNLIWQRRFDQPMVGGLLATAGDLVFTGEGNGAFHALDAETGTTLWTHQAEYGVNAPAVTYRIDGRQYLAVAAGGNGLFGFPTGDRLLVFALPD